MANRAPREDLSRTLVVRLADWRTAAAPTERTELTLDRESIVSDRRHKLRGYVEDEWKGAWESCWREVHDPSTPSCKNFAPEALDQAFESIADRQSA